jgi:hypothetical protein
VTWTVHFVGAAAKVEVDRLSIDLRAKFERIVELIKSRGLENVREPPRREALGNADDRLGRHRSFDLHDRDREARDHTFIKKTDKTPRRALAMARSRITNVR